MIKSVLAANSVIDSASLSPARLARARVAGERPAETHTDSVLQAAAMVAPMVPGWRNPVAVIGGVRVGRHRRRWGRSTDDADQHGERGDAEHGGEDHRP